MQKQKLISIFAFIILNCLFASCARPDLIPTPSPENTKIFPTLPNDPTPGSPTPTIYVSPIAPVSELGSFIPSILADSVSKETYEKITERLMTQWLDYFQTVITPDSPSRLEEYEILEVIVPPEWQHLVAEQPDAFVAEVIFSVRPVHSPSPDWIAGNGNIGEDNWINNKSLFMIVMKSEGVYTLDFLGTSP
jgi:hypothetical protein